MPFWFDVKFLHYWVTVQPCHSVFDKLVWHTIGQRASYFALHSSLFRPVVQLILINIITNSINSLLFGAKCIPNGTHTNDC